MMPRDPSAPGWEHAVLYALDIATGGEVVRRVLPDPSPVAALVVSGGIVHVVSTRRGEPIFGYAFSASDLVPLHRRIVALAIGTRHDDVLDAWAAADGGLWLELDAVVGVEGKHVLAYVFVDAEGATHEIAAQHGSVCGDGTAPARDACAGGHDLFAPLDGKWVNGDAALPPGLRRLEPHATTDVPPPDDAEAAWARATVVGPRAQIHALGSEGVVCAVAAADDPEKPERARVEVFAWDRSSAHVQWRAQSDHVSVKSHLGDSARVARRPNGEILFQSLGADGVPRTALVCARPDGRLDEIHLGRGAWVLDAALGDLVLAHREDVNGGVQVGGIAIDHEGRLLGRRAVVRWAIEAGNLGGGTTVYAGAGAVVVRGECAVCAVHL